MAQEAVPVTVRRYRGGSRVAALVLIALLAIDLAGALRAHALLPIGVVLGVASSARALLVFCSAVTQPAHWIALNRCAERSGAELWLSCEESRILSTAGVRPEDALAMSHRGDTVEQMVVSKREGISATISDGML